MLIRFLAMLAMLAVPAWGQQPQVDMAVLARAQQALGEFQRASGNFVQIAPDGSLSSGLFHIQRPGKLRFEYTGDMPFLLICDGVTVSMLDARLETFDRIPLATTPLNLFLGNDIDLYKQGLVQRTLSSAERHFVTMTDPEQKTEGYLTLEFFEPEFTLQGWSVHDPTGAITRIILKDVSTDTKQPAALFVIEDPEDQRDRER